MIRIIKNSLLLSLLTLLPCQLSAQLQRYEYWFDDDYAGKTSVQLSGSEADISTEIPTEGLTCGIHTLHFRVKQEGGKYSSISSTVFFKSAGQIDRLQYWFDDDFEHAKTTTSIEGGSEITFMDNWDLSDVPEGFHRLYYRGVNGNQQASTAINMTPVMVKSRYNTDGKELKVVLYSVSIDDEAPVTYNVLDPKDEITQPHTLDARQLAEGNHTVSVHFWNTTGGGTSVQQQFTKVREGEPTITLGAVVEDGLVKLQFNSIPNDVRYRVWRRSQGSTAVHKVKVRDAAYPSNLQVTDNPTDGSYAYLIQGFYIDANGESQEVRSEEVNLTVSSASHESAATGCIIGRITIDSKQTFLLPMSIQLDVTFSDGVTVRAQQNGTFRRDGIPYGTELTMTVADNPYYTFEQQTVTVDANTRNRLFVISATENKQGVQNDNSNYDLVITSAITGIPDKFCFTVKNMTQHSWTGYVRLKAVKRDSDTNPDNVLSFKAMNPYNIIGSVYIVGLGAYKSKNVEITVENFPPLSKNTFFNFYLLSESSGTMKLLECVSDEATNPKTLEIEAQKPETHDSPYALNEDIDDCIDEILKRMKEMVKYGGSLASALEWYSDMKSLEKNDEYKVLRSFSNELRKKIEEVGDVTSFLNDVNDFYDTMEEVVNWKDKDDFDKFVYVTKKAFSMAGPYAKIYQQYLLALEECKESIDKISERIEEYELPKNFYSGIMEFRLKVVKKEHSFMGLHWNNYYTGKEIRNQIKEVSVVMETVKNPSKSKPYKIFTKGDNITIGGIKYDITIDNDEVLLKENSNYLLELKDIREKSVLVFYMKIHWKNGRVDIVPLMNDELVDIKKSGDNLDYTITLRSGASHAENMADIIHINKKN